MKSKKFKGFTLIECLVALAILGIASLIMAQIYANVSRINRNNHLVNTSLSYQMKYVEEKTDTEAVGVYYGGSKTYKDSGLATPITKPPASGGGAGSNNNYIKIQSDYEYVDFSSTAGEKNVYSVGIDVYALLSRDQNDHDKDDSGYSGQAEDNYNLRYKYILGHTK